MQTAGKLAVPLSALSAGADVNQRLEAELPAIERAVLLRQLVIGSRTSDIPLPARD